MTRYILVSQGLQGRDEGWSVFQAVNTDHDVNHRLCRQAGYCRAANVFYAENVLSDGVQNPVLFLYEQVHPGWVIGEDLNGNIIWHIVYFL